MKKNEIASYYRFEQGMCYTYCIPYYSNPDSAEKFLWIRAFFNHKDFITQEPTIGLRSLDPINIQIQNSFYNKTCPFFSKNNSECFMKVQPKRCRFAVKSNVSSSF